MVDEARVLLLPRTAVAQFEPASCRVVRVVFWPLGSVSTGCG